MIAPNWSEEDEEKLARLVQTGWPAWRIGKQFDPPRTANAIIGKATRMGLKVGRSRPKKPNLMLVPPEDPKPEIPRMPEPVDRGVLCGMPSCSNTRQPGRAWCHAHIPIPRRRRANMVDIFTGRRGDYD